MYNKTYILIMLFLVACQTKEKTTQPRAVTITQKQKVDSMRIQKDSRRNTLTQDESDRLWFDKWFKGAKQLVNRNIMKDTLMYAENGFVVVAPFRHEKDSFLLVDITKDKEDDKAHNKKYLFQKKGKKWQVIDFYETIQPSVVPSKKTILMLDINFDNQKDIVFSAPTGSASRILEFYQFFLRTPEGYKYYEISPKKDYPTFFWFSTSTIGIDTVQQQLTTWGDGGNFGTHSKDIFKWVDGKLVITKSLEKTYNMGKDVYLFQELIYEQNKRKLVKEWTIRKEKEAEKTFENWEKAPTTQYINFL
jgi:hypothetical protein